MPQTILSPRSGFHYFLQGFSLAFAPKTRLFVLLPLLINILIFGSAFLYLFYSLSDWINYWLGFIPDWLDWLYYVLWPMIFLGSLLSSSYFFSILANWIASPFNGVLSEHIEAKLSGEKPPQTGIFDILKDLPRILVREWKKLTYFIPRALGLILLFFIPGLGQTITPLLWFIFNAWMLSLQYSDYPFDNHKISFKSMRRTLCTERTRQFTFGLSVSLVTMVPIVNLIIMPVAVCGATALWVDLYKNKIEI